jgi:LysM repeat protein
MRRAVTGAALALSLAGSATGWAQEAPAQPAYRVLGQSAPDAPSDQPAQGEPQTFVEVERGDTLAEIAQEAGVELKDVRRLNPRIDPRKLMPGDKIRLPNSSRDGGDAFLCPGDPRC